jgi:hypothetical protein
MVKHEPELHTAAAWLGDISGHTKVMVTPPPLT